MQRSTHFKDVVVPGSVGGLIAGAVVGVWFLATDLMAGQAFLTPALLGQVILQLPEFDVSWRLLATYTVLHVGTFVALGVATAWCLKVTGLAPSLLLGALFGIVVLDVAYYSALLVAGTNVFDVLAWYQVVPANVLAGMALMGYLHRASRDARPFGWSVLRGHPVLTEGIGAGLVGAATVAVWFLLIDTAAGRPFHTPAALGSAVFLGAQSEGDVHASAGLLAGYTMLHVAVFVSLGVLMAAVATYLERAASRVLLVALALIVCEAGVVAGLWVIAAWVLGSIGLWAITVANALALAAMGWYVWRTHRALPGTVRYATADV